MEIEVSVNDMSPAHRASVLGNREELIQILEVKILLFDSYQKAKNYHEMAVRRPKIISYIFKTNPDLKDLTDHFGRTPLIYCILADRVNTAKYLIKSGAQISSG